MGLGDRLAALAPGLSKWDLRQVDGDIDKRTVLHTAAGFVLGTLLLTPFPVLVTAATPVAGQLGAQVIGALYKLVAVYMAILLSVHWSQLDDG